MPFDLSNIFRKTHSQGPQSTRNWLYLLHLVAIDVNELEWSWMLPPVSVTYPSIVWDGYNAKWIFEAEFKGKRYSAKGASWYLPNKVVEGVLGENWANIAGREF